MVVQHSIEDLENLKDLLKAIPSRIYSQKLDVLSGSSIGEHTRHVLEFYGCLFESEVSGEVDYDNRKRSNELQTEVEAAIIFLGQMIARLKKGVLDIPLKLTVNFSKTKDQKQEIKSSVLRELAYCLEHSIHHKALIKIGLTQSGYGHLVEQHFGVAASTIRSRANQPEMTISDN